VNGLVGYETAIISRDFNRPQTCRKATNRGQPRILTLVTAILRIRYSIRVRATSKPGRIL